MGDGWHERTRSSRRALARPRRSRSQSGSVLLYVLAMVLFLSVCVVVILSMSLNSDSVAHKLEDSTRHDHQVDGVLEDVVNEVRNDSGACTTGITVGQFAVDCTSMVISADPPARRADFTVTEDGDSAVVGKARIKVVDDPSEGYTLEVCDWLLSRNVGEDVRGCD